MSIPTDVEYRNVVFDRLCTEYSVLEPYSVLLVRLLTVRYILSLGFRMFLNGVETDQVYCTS
jgi:hypothetical protein